jgi:fumarate reductase subunit D
MGKKPTGEQMLFGVLAYLGILVLIPLLLKKDDDFIHWHAKQGLVLLIAYVVVWVFTMIPIIGWILGPIISLVLFVFAIIAIVQVLMGNQWQLPLLGKYADKFNV